MNEDYNEKRRKTLVLPVVDFAETIHHIQDRYTELKTIRNLNEVNRVMEKNQMKDRNLTPCLSISSKKITSHIRVQDSRDGYAVTVHLEASGHLAQDSMLKPQRMELVLDNAIGNLPPIPISKISSEAKRVMSPALRSSLLQRLP